MARKKTTSETHESPKPSNEGKLVRLAPDVVAMGKNLAATDGRHLSDYLSDILRGILRERYAQFMKENAPKSVPKGRAGES